MPQAGIMLTSLPEQLPEYALYADFPPCYDPEKALKDFEALTPEQKRKLGTGIALAVGCNEADKEFEKASTSATIAVRNIESMFVTLTAKLTRLGADTQHFLDTFTTIKKIFADVLKNSYNLAISIAQYADSFDKLIVKFCADETITVEQRIAKIKEFIKKAEGIKTDAGNMQERFVELKDRFSKFVRSFSAWAKSREVADGEETIKDLYEHIRKLDKKISQIDTAMKVISGSFAATLPITGILTLLFPLAAPFIVTTGLALAGIELTSVGGLFLGKNVLLKKKCVDEGKIRDLGSKISKITATRVQLEEDGQVALMTFADNISVIQNVWTKVVNDATEIWLWLEQGANYAEYPNYMKVSLEEGVNIYSRMGKYLRDYANGVTETVKTFKP